MRNNADKHLNEDQMVQAMVDASALPSTVREHVSACPDCLERNRAFEQEMETLGRIARESLPRPRRRIRLPEARKPFPGLFFEYHSWRLASAVGTALMVLFVGWNVFFKVLPERRLAGLEEEIQRDAQFMAEISDLVENPLPKVLRAISGEDYKQVDDDLMDFILPKLEEDENSPSPA